MNCFYFTNVREMFIKSKILQAECFVWCLFVNYSALFCIFMRKAYRFRNFLEKFKTASTLLENLNRI